MTSTEVDIVEKPWRKSVNWSNMFEELERLKDEIENYQPLSSLLPGEVAFPQVNILLMGGIGAGKSSVYNTWNSVFRGKIFNVARSGCSEHSLTTKFSKYPIMSGTALQPTPLNFRVCDTRGLEEAHLMNKENMRHLLEGNIPDKFQFDPAGNISSDMPGFNKNPRLDEKIHCVAIVQDASVFSSEFGMESHSVIRNIKDMQIVMNSLDVPQVVILTKVDIVSREVANDAAKTFNSKKIWTCVSKISAEFGVQRNLIFPMKNYEIETKNDSSIDIMALLALNGILNRCDGFLYNKRDEICRSYKVEDFK